MTSPHTATDPRLIHGRFTPLRDKMELVKAWPGINPQDVDAALARATDRCL